MNTPNPIEGNQDANARKMFATCQMVKFDLWPEVQMQKK